MANNIIRRVWNQNRMVNIEDITGAAFQAEIGAHTFEISGIDDTGAAVALSGTVSGVFRRPDNADIALTGSASDGVVSVTLSEDCYAVPGRFGLTIFVTSNSQKVAVYACVGTVAVSSTGNVAGDTPANVEDLIDDINAAIADLNSAIGQIPASYANVMAAIAPTYSGSALYSVGSYAWYNGSLYRCITAITTAEAWTAAHWTAAVLGDDVSNLKSALQLETNNLANTTAKRNDNFVNLPFTFKHGQISTGQIAYNITYRVVSTPVVFDGYDYIDFVMEDLRYQFAVYYWSDEDQRWYPAEYNTNSFIKGGRFRVFDKTKQYMIYCGWYNGSTQVLPISDITEAVKIQGGYYNDCVTKDNLKDACENGVFKSGFAPIPFYSARVDGGGYSVNVGEMSCSPIMVSGYDSIVIKNTNQSFRFAVYNVDNDGYHMLSGGWVDDEAEYQGIKNYIIRVGRKNGSTSALTQTEFNDILSSFSATLKKSVSISATPVSKAEIYLSGKKVSISGDSRSTYQGTQPTGYPYYYPKSAAGLTELSQTWWKRVIDHYGMTFVANAAWSGGLTGIKSGFDALASACNDARISALADGTTNPDIIIVYTGVNDWINNVPMGSYDGSGSFPSTYETFSDAVAIMIKKIQTAYPNADLWLMANSYSNPESTATTAPDMAIPKISTRLLAQYNAKMEELCKKMCVTGYINLEFCGVNHMNIQTYATDYPGSSSIHGLHYNAAGHKRIADYVIAEFEKYYNRD